MDLEVGKEKGNHDLTTTVALVEMKETVLSYVTYATLHTTAKMEYLLSTQNPKSFLLQQNNSQWFCMFDYSFNYLFVCVL